MRRHFLFPEQEHERGVGDAENGKNLLQLWLERRNQLQQHDQINWHLLMFWDLVKPTTQSTLTMTDYVTFFAAVVKALVQTVDADIAGLIAQRDWIYDTEGANVLTLEGFRESMMQIVELILPLESELSMFTSFFLELRESLAMVDGSSILTNDIDDENNKQDGEHTPRDGPATSSSTERQEKNNRVDLTLKASLSAPHLYEAVSYKLRPLTNVTKICEPFLQKMPPTSDQLSMIHGLSLPNTQQMSLKQLLLCYNPRKLALSRKFSSLFQSSTAKVSLNSSNNQNEQHEVGRLEDNESILMAERAAPVMAPKMLNKESEDPWDSEDAVVQSLEAFPAFRIAVVGPPGSGKTRVAKMLAKRLHLRYFSLATALEEAIVRKKIRDNVRASAKQTQQEEDVAVSAGEGENSSAVAATEATGGETEIVVQSNEDASESAQSDRQLDDASSLATEENRMPLIEEPLHEEDRLFTDADRDALFLGHVLPRAKTLEIFTFYAKKSLLEDIGIVVDDIHPIELEHVIGIDFLVALQAIKEDIQHRIEQFTIAPTSRRVYSACELAILKHDPFATGIQGFADYIQEEPTLSDYKPPEKASADEELNPEVDDTGNSEEVSPDTYNEDDEAVEPPSTAPPTAVERNEIVPPNEPTLPLRSLLLNSFSNRYKDYLDRIQSRLVEYSRATGSSSLSALSGNRYHVIHVLAAQSPCLIIDQCLHAISGNTIGISRNSFSRQVCPISLPEELTSNSRADQIRWLLHGDWSSLLAAQDITNDNAQLCFSQLPKGKRRFSKWKEFCPVMSSAEMDLVLGDPCFAATFSGRVYLFANEDARASFCAHPLQFLRKKPQAKPLERIWLVSSLNIDPYLSHWGASLQLPNYSATSLITAHAAMSVQMEWMEGKKLSPVHAATLVADVIHKQQNHTNKWLLSNLLLAKDTVEALKESECLPDVLMIMEPDADVLEREAKTTKCGTIIGLKHQTVQQTQQEACNLLKEYGVSVRTCPLYNDVDDSLAALIQELNPLAPRIDRIEDGYLLADEGITVFTYASENDEEPRNMQAQMGETGRFCPVSWHNKGILVPGSAEFVSSFALKYYAFAGRQEQLDFERNPTKYLPQNRSQHGGGTVTHTPCIVFLGVQGSGRRQLTASLEALTAHSDAHTLLDVDLDHVQMTQETQIKLESLKEESNRESIERLYITSLKKHFQQTLISWRENRATASTSPVLLVAGFGHDTARVPSKDFIQICFEQGMVPSLVIPLTIAQESVIPRLLNEWRAGLPQPRRRPKNISQVSDDKDVDVEEEEEAEINLEEAEAEELQRLQEQYQFEQEAITTAIEVFQARGVTVTAPIDVSGTLRQSVKKIAVELKAFMARKDSLFDFCEVVDKATFTEMLTTGEAFVGKHGNRCPVTDTYSVSVLNRNNSLDTAVLYRDRLYFPDGHDARMAFMANPCLYLQKRTVAACQQPTCCITGAPYVGKTKLAKALAARYHLVYVSPAAAIDWVLQCHGGTALWKTLQEAKSIDAIPDATVVHEAICTRLQSSECLVNGWILDDYILESSQLHRCRQPTSLVEPALLFILDGKFHHVWEMKKRSITHVTDDKEDQHFEETKVRAERAFQATRDKLIGEFAAWQKYRLELLGYWSTTFGESHVKQIDAHQSSFWNIIAQAQHHFEVQQMKARNFWKEHAAGLPSRVDGVARSLDYVSARVHPVFRVFCPVELSESRYHASSVSNRQLCVEFQGYHFWLANELNLARFLDRPHDFISAEQERDASELLDRLPVDASLLSLISVADCDFPELKGYCPVTFKMGAGAKDWNSIVKGHIFYRATYQHKVYFFASEDMRRKFLLEPTLYARQNLPVKLPPQVSIALTKNYPGKLEQELSAVLNEALLALGSERPKFLQVSTRASACFYMALILKTESKRLPEHIKTKFREKKEAFEYDCRLGLALKASLTPYNASCGTAIKGVRAVRGPATPDRISEMDVDEVYRRFDFITGIQGSVPLSSPTNISTIFREYASI